MNTEKDSLLRDLVDPVKSFVEEVHSDTVGDAKKFYTAQARKMKRSIDDAQAQAKQKKAVQKRRQEERQVQRKAMRKKALIVFVVIIKRAAGIPLPETSAMRKQIRFASRTK